MNADWPFDTDFLRYMVIDDSLADSIPEAAELSFEEPEATKLFDEALFLVDSIPEATELFNEAFFLAGSMPEAAGLFGEAFFLVDSTSEAAELFEKFCFSDPVPEDSRLTEEALHDPSDSGVPTRYLVGPNAARPSDLSVPGATATDTDKELQKITV